MKTRNRNSNKDISDIRINEYKAKYGRPLVVKLACIRQRYVQLDRCLYGGCLHSYPFAIAKSREEGFSHKILRLESNQALNEQAKQNSGFSNEDESESLLREDPVDGSLSKHFATEDFFSGDTKKEPNLHPKDKLKKSLIDFAAGSLAGIAQIYASQPFDTVKVKQQTFPKLYGGMLKCFVHTYRKNGVVRGLYAGTLPAAVSSLAENSVLFTAYGACQKAVASVMEMDGVAQLTALDNACAGFLAAFFSSFTMCPIELIKCKLQAVHEMKHYVDKRGTATPITPVKLTKDIFVKEGIPGFYRGLSSTIAREMPGYFFFFGGYEATREYFVQPNQTKDDIGPFRTMCAGAVGGVASWTLTYPVDVVKTRIQINNLKDSMLSVGSEILRKEGFLALYSGLLPTVLRTIPATATLFLVYEYSKKVLTEKFS